MSQFLSENKKFINTTKKISEKNQIKFYDMNEYIEKKNFIINGFMLTNPP